MFLTLNPPVATVLRIVICYRHVPDAESAGSYRTERMVYGIEERHPGKHQQQGLGNDQSDIDQSSDVDCPEGSCTISLLGKRGKFYIGEPQAERTGIRHDEKQEYHHSEPSDEMSGRPPEKQASRQGLYVGKDGRTCGSIP